MKSIFKIMVLGVVPILMTTAVVDRGYAADAGSQLIFQSNINHQDFISVANTNDKMAVTVLVQYYNDEMKRVLWYLRVVPGGGNFMVDPFNHAIPGQDTDVMTELNRLPAMTQTTGDKLPGINSGRFVIAVTAVGANVKAKYDRNSDGDFDDGTGTITDAPAESATAILNRAPTVNVLFPSFLAAGMHGTDNIDNCGMLQSDVPPADDGATPPVANPDYATNNNLGLTKAADADDNCDADDDHTSKNVGDLNVGNAEPIAFNFLSGHYTSALVGTSSGGSDQTASWGGAPVTRPAVNVLPVSAIAAADANDDATPSVDETVAVDAVMPMMISTTYTTLNGMNAVDGVGGRLADKMAGGMSGRTMYVVEGYTNEGGNKKGTTGKIVNRGTAAPDSGERFSDLGAKRVVNDGELSVPALYAGSEDQIHHVVQFLSVTDDFGDPAKGKGGDYSLLPAKTKYMVSLQDGMGDEFKDPADERKFGGAAGPDLANTRIIVDGIQVEVNAKACSGTAIMGAWSVSSLTALIPAANEGSGKFGGLMAMLDPMESVSPGLISFKREALSCKVDAGDGTPATSGGDPSVDGDGVPATDVRTYAGGTLYIEEKDNMRSFVTTGSLVVKYITPMATFAASWPLNSSM